VRRNHQPFRDAWAWALGDPVVQTLRIEGSPGDAYLGGCSSLVQLLVLCRHTRTGFAESDSSVSEVFSFCRCSQLLSPGPPSGQRDP
jgi:hypothetical protein